MKDIETILSELLAWKERQESLQAERITEMHNAIAEIFISRHATIAEINTVLDITKSELTSKFINAKKAETKAIASTKEPAPITGSDLSKKEKEYPAKIKE